jgi:hypothetical protein
MPNLYLTKSDFKVGRECPRKIYYRKMKYPSRMDEDPYLQFLAEGGYMVGEIAKMLYPDGIDIQTLDVEEALTQTRELLQRDRVTLFEPAILWDCFLVRVDVLIKEGDQLHLVEVKSKSGEAPAGETPFFTQKGGIAAEWRPYVEDCAFQAFVLRNAFPDAHTRVSLMVPDKGALCPIDGLSGQFKLTRNENRRGVAVSFTGDREAVRGSGFLRLFPADEAIALVASEVSDAAREFALHVRDGVRPAEISIGYQCRNCEYHYSNGDGRNGFLECWGELGTVSPHLFELYQLGRVKREDKTRTADFLIQSGLTSLHDIPLADLSGAFAAKQRIQIQNTLEQTEWIAPALKDILAGAPYPLHFIDFEASRTAVPPHRGLRPYGLVAFQWSCHTIEQPGQAPQHRDWINTRDVFPNVEFAESLRQCVGDTGVLLVWSPYEKSCLKDIAKRLREAPEFAPDGLLPWLERVTSEENRIVDMCKLAREYYYHPRMKGSHSIKAVLPAVWENNPTLRAHPWFSAYAENPSDPYQSLPPIEIAEKAELIKEGTGAIRAYQDMLYGEHKDDPGIRDRWTELLRQYCELDTMAMVIIWMHWRMRLEEVRATH